LLPVRVRINIPCLGIQAEQDRRWRAQDALFRALDTCIGFVGRTPIRHQIMAEGDSIL
jgi:hypothetical protein